MMAAQVSLRPQRTLLGTKKHCNSPSGDTAERQMQMLGMKLPPGDAEKCRERDECFMCSRVGRRLELVRGDKSIAVDIQPA